MERQITNAPHGHILTNANVWSPDGRRIVYDVRSDPAGERFDGNRIETIDVETGEVRVLFESQRGANCGVATFHPTENRVVFILGPEDPSPEFSYGAARRRGVMVDEDLPHRTVSLEARDLVPPFTAGALRGGSHVHMFAPNGSRVSFTYEDHILETGSGERNQRHVGVSVLGHRVQVPKTHSRNHDGTAFSVLVTRTADDSQHGSNDISKAFEDAWVGVNGYVRADGTRQRWAIAFQGHVRTASGETISEVFIADLPDNLTQSLDEPIEGTARTRPRPPLGVQQRRMTFTESRRFPGIQGPRHWLRSSPDGRRIAFLMKDDEGIFQLFSVSPNSGEPSCLTRNPESIASAFTWNHDGSRIAFVMGGCVCVTEIPSGQTIRLTQPGESSANPRPEACVFSPDGQRIAYVRHVNNWNQIFVCDVPD